MNMKDMILIEFMKVRRSKLLPLIMIPPFLVVISGIANLSQYFTPEYKNAWAAMFVQSGLLFGYYLLPFSMVVVCVMIAGHETKNNGILKMLALPISRSKLALAKFVVLLCYLAFELIIFFFTFAISGAIATKTMNISETLPIMYILKWSLILFLTTIPSIAVMWLITVLSEKLLISIGLNMLLVIPGVLVANTPLWMFYPYCYSGCFISTELHRVSTGIDKFEFPLFPFIPCALSIFIIAVCIAVMKFGKKEME